jgi:hypothetical protein
VDSKWLEKLTQGLKRPFSLDRLRIPLSRAERTLIRRLETAIDLDRMVGATAAAMLRLGFKLELEGAINPRFHRDSDTRWIFGLLRSRAKAGGSRFGRSSERKR